MNETEQRIRASKSEAFKRLNSGLLVGGLHGSQPQPEQRRALEQKSEEIPQRKDRVVGSRKPIARVQIIRCSSRVYDSDNHIAGSKPIRDAIAASLGLDDADSEIEWEYSQIRTRGKRGTLVKLELLTNY